MIGHYAADKAELQSHAVGAFCGEPVVTALFIHVCGAPSFCEIEHGQSNPKGAPGRPASKTDDLSRILHLSVNLLTLLAILPVRANG